MDFLVDRKDRSLDNFYKNMIMYLSFYGLGSVKSLLSLKMYELHELKRCLKDDDIKEKYYNMRGLTLKD